MVLAFVALFVAPLALSPFAQSAHSAAAVAGGGRIRDLGVATPESVGVSSERVHRIEAAMNKLVDDKQVAGLVTLLERHGKVIAFNAVGQKDVRKSDPVQKDSIFRITTPAAHRPGIDDALQEGKWRIDDPVARYSRVCADEGLHRQERGRHAKARGREAVDDDEGADDAYGGLGYVLSAAGDVEIIDGNVLSAPRRSRVDRQPRQAAALAQPGTLVGHRRGRAGLSSEAGHAARRLLRTRVFEPLSMKTRRSTCRRKMSRLALVHNSGRTGLVDENRLDRRWSPGPLRWRRIFSTAMDYARFCEMMLGGGQLNGVRIIAPRTVEMMRTNHVNPDPLKTMPQGTGWGMDFQIVMDAAAAGDSVPNGTYSWFGIAGTWFWIDTVEDLAFVGMVQHVNLGTTRGIHGLSRSLVYRSIMN
jgi:CubicO group peptidase (beta-lactamase class C family)